MDEAQHDPGAENERVRVELASQVATITLNRPDKKNALSPAMFCDLASALERAEQDQRVRAVVLTGAGGDFSSGADQTATAEDEAPYAGLHPLERLRRIGDVALRLHRLSKPTIARVEGVAVGAGCNLALGCDFVLATPEARFSEIFIRRALSIDFGGSWLLPRIVGLQRAKELAMFGDILSADEAHAIGLVSRVVPRGELDDTVRQWASRLAAAPSLALSLTKALLNHGMGASMEIVLEAEGAASVTAQSSADAVEAKAAFVDKREAVFTGGSLLPSKDGAGAREEPPTDRPASES